MSQYYYNPFGDNRDMNEEKRRQFEIAQKKKQQKKELRIVSFTIGLAIMAYIWLQTVAVSVLTAFGWYDLYKNNAVFQYAFTIIGISFLSVAVPFGIMALINKKKYISPVVPNRKIKFGKCMAWVCFGMAVCIIANYVVSFVVVIFKELFGLQLTQGETLEPDSIFACVLTIIGTAIIPAICEEFAMRCCCLQLLKKYGKGFAVFAVSIVFGLLHGNVIQFVFAFLVGLVLGFMTVKTESVVPAILVHAFNNAISAVSSVITYAAGEDVSENAVIVMYIFWFAAGVISTLYLLLTNSFKRENNNKSLLTTGQRISAFLFPGMIIPFAILIVFTAFSVEHI